MSQLQKAPEEKNITDHVLAKIKIFESAGALVLPNNYSAANALKAAFLILSETKNKDGKPVLEVCTPNSIANSLLKMVVWGLSPLKKQCDFIPYGSILTCQPEYTGNIALAKRYGKMQWIRANAVFQGEEFEFGIDIRTGKQKLLKHQRDPKLFGGQVVGAYALLLVDGEDVDMEYMDIEQIKNAWNQGQAKGQSMAHKNFSDQMAIKTVINRATKLLIRSSDDSPILAGFDDENDSAKSAVDSEIMDRANKIDFNFDPHEEVKESAKSLPEKKVNPIESFEGKKIEDPVSVKEEKIQKVRAMSKTEHDAQVLSNNELKESEPPFGFD